MDRPDEQLEARGVDQDCSSRGGVTAWLTPPSPRRVSALSAKTAEPAERNRRPSFPHRQDRPCDRRACTQPLGRTARVTRPQATQGCLYATPTVKPFQRRLYVRVSTPWSCRRANRKRACPVGMGGWRPRASLNRERGGTRDRRQRNVRTVDQALFDGHGESVGV